MECRNTSVVRISIYCRQYRIKIWNYQQCYILLSKRASALLFVVFSLLYLPTSWLLWPIIIQVPTSFTGAPQNFPFSCFAEQFFLLLDLTLTCSLACYLPTCFSYSVTDSLHKPFSCVISIILKNGYSPHIANLLKHNSPSVHIENATVCYTGKKMLCCFIHTNYTTLET